MKTLKLTLATIFCTITAVGAVALMAPPDAGAAEPMSEQVCPNTWCAPGDSFCRERLDWQCTLSGGCASYSKCGKT